MNALHHLSRGLAQRAASEIRNTINGVASEVHEMSAALDELAARENKSLEPGPGAEVESGAASPPHQQNAPPAAASREAAVQQPSPAVASVPLPQIPDLRPQLEAVRDALLRNQQTTVDTLRAMRLLLDAYGSQLAELREQIKGQQNAMGNMRRW